MRFNRDATLEGAGNLAKYGKLEAARYFNALDASLDPRLISGDGFRSLVVARRSGSRSQSSLVRNHC